MAQAGTRLSFLNRPLLARATLSVNRDTARGACPSREPAGMRNCTASLSANPYWHTRVTVRPHVRCIGHIGAHMAWTSMRSCAIVTA
jgi:hypothetical protein